MCNSIFICIQHIHDVEEELKVEPRQEPSWPREQGHGYKEMCSMYLCDCETETCACRLGFYSAHHEQHWWWSRVKSSDGYRKKISTELSQINAPSSTELRVRRNNAMWWSITRFNHRVQLNLWHQISSIIFCHHIYYDNIVIIFSVVISSVSRRGIVTS